MKHHRVLQRQMKTFGVGPGRPPRDDEAWDRFLERVNRFYHQADQDRYLLERSLAISSREMHELYDDLRQASESRIAAERDKLRAVISSLGAGLCTLDIEGRVVSINPEGERLLGATEAEMRGRPFPGWQGPSGDGQMPERPGSLADVIASGMPYREEDGVFLRRDGRLLPVSYTVNPIAEEGTLGGAVLVFFDITERKRAEEALREGEQRFRDLFESSPDAIFVEDLDGNVIDVNPAACRLHRTDAEQIVGRNVQTLVPPALREEAMAAFAQMVTGEVDRLEGTSWTADGQEIPVEIRVNRITQDHQPALLLQVRDITERKQAEQRLRLLEASVSASLDGITISDALQDDHPLIYVSPGFERMTGYAAPEILGRNCRFLQHGDRDQPALGQIRKALGAGAPCRVVLRNYRKDGTLFWNELTLYPLHDNHGQLTHYVGIQRDITGRKQVEEALRRSEERYTLAVSAGNVGVWDWNLETDEIYIDPILKQILGYEDHDIQNRLEDWGRLVHPDDQDKVMAAATAHREGRTAVYDVEHRMLHRQGGVRWFVARGTIMRDAAGTPVRMVGTDTDITERKQAAQELARINAKLEQRNRELQDFAHVASHDLQEPLRKIRAFADLMREDYGDKVDATGQYYLDRMQDAATRMAGLITDLLVYSRVTTKVQPFGTVDLNAVVTDVLSDLEMQIKETGGRIIVSDLPAIDADATQMHQLLQNFVGNALKFHRPGVAPVVEVVGALEEHPAPGGAASRFMCRLEVRDNGIGFDEKYLDRIFTPFQRLHGRGSYAGTGMGLAICRRIVERHHGTITAHSAPDEGARFVIVLPARQPPVASEGEAG